MNLKGALPFLTQIVLGALGLIIAWTVSAQSDTVRARIFLEKAKENFSNPSRADSMGIAAYQLAGLNVPLRGESAYLVCFVNSNRDFAKARQWGDSAIFWFKKNDNALWIGYTYRVLGVRSTARNQNDQALTYLQESSHYFEKARDTAMMVQTDISLALLYHNNLSDYRQGLEYAQSAHQRLGSMKDPPASLAWQVNNTLGISFDDLGQSDEAIAWHSRNLETENASFRANTMNNIGNTLRKQGKFREAEGYLKKSLDLAALDDHYLRATVLLNMAQVNEDLGRRSLALRYNDSSVARANVTGDIEKMRDAYEFSHRLNRKAGLWTRAYDDLQHYLEIKDSVMNRSKAEIIYGLEEKFQSVQREQQLASLRSETLAKDLEIQRSRFLLLAGLGLGTALAVLALWLFKRHRYRENLTRSREREELQRQRFSAVIEAEENERARVAKDLHDGLGQLISTAKLGLTAVRIPPGEPSAGLLSNSIQVLDQAAQEVRAIAHNLMPAALTERGLQPVLEDMIAKINASRMLEVQLDLQVGDQRLPNTVEVAVYRVVQEVLNNMLKHADADRVVVKLVREGNSLRLSMSDNGVGFDKAVISRSKGLGWKNILSRISMLNGDIEVQSAPGAGTSINVQFALS
ncbi:MAG: sensor histidine kinase [Cyclobacteriaceae bacterium]|nr:sensor histidine kinase [Cyclobacteriaceae bacterium]